MKIIKCNTGNIVAVLTERENVDDKLVKANSVDAAFEKHVPQLERNDDKVTVVVNHVMEDDHYIEWICLLTDDKEEYIYLKDEPKAIFDKVEKGKIYSYCNKHGLWVSDIE
jgi:superoxide reductase